MIDALENISMDGFQVVKRQFFETPTDPLMTVWGESIGFSAAAYEALENCQMVRILLNNERKAVMVMPATSSDPEAMKWKATAKVCKFRRITCPSFAKKLMVDWGLDLGAKYRCYGKAARVESKVVLLFDFTTAIKLEIPKKE